MEIWDWKNILLALSTPFLVVVLWFFYKCSRWASCSPLHSVSSALKQQMIITVMNAISFFANRSFEKECKKAVETQNSLLATLLKDNASSEYGVAWNFSQMNNREKFQELHPLTDYSHYKEWMDRIEQDGNHNTLSNYDFVKLAMTSGTSGSRKLLPFTKKQRGVFFLKGILVIYSHLLRVGGFSLQKSCKFMYLPTQRISHSGLTMGPNSSSPEDSKSMMCLFATPMPGYLEIHNEVSALYTHLLFALKDPFLGQFEANFISIIFHAFQFLFEHWKELVADIRSGTINKSYEMPAETRKKLEKSLGGPDALRASCIEQEFEKGLEMIISRLWKRLRCILAVNTGSFALYDEKLRKYISPSIPRYSPIYAATEGLLGINLKENTEKYILVPGAMFFEFIPMCGDDVESIPLFIDQVEIGKVYELVITNFSGLYRYRMGDVIKVVSFHGEALEVVFQYRKGQMINIRGEKTSEKAFTEAICSVAWPFPLVEFTCVDPALEETSFPTYSIYVELEGEYNGNMQDLVSAVDDAMARANPIYLSFREKGSISSPLLHFVHKGTFSQLKEEMIQAGTGINQVKIPRVTRYSSHISLLKSSRLQNMK